MKKLFITLLFLSEIFASSAQIASCDGYRYKNSVFNQIDSVTDVQYGMNYTISNVLQKLTLDIYLPETDTIKKRPLIIFIHGGKLITGNKHDTRILCNLFALKGFVTATIDYRLIDVPVVDSTIAVEGLIQAMGDAKAAVRFFVEDAATLNVYKIDTNYIFISGVSAGGLIASHVAYLDSTDNIPPYFLNLIDANGGFPGNSSTNTAYSAPIKGIINYSGALIRKEFISTGEPALFSVHDDGDTIVPCNHGLSQAYNCPVYCDGSCVMQQEADLKGVYNGIYINHRNGHCAYFSTFPLVDTVIQKSADFLYGIICLPYVTVRDQNYLQNSMQIFPNPANESIHVVLPALPEGDEKLQFFNSMGVLYRVVDAKQPVQINISDFPKGVYFVHLDSHLGQTQSFIIQ